MSGCRVLCRAQIALTQGTVVRPKIEPRYLDDTGYDFPTAIASISTMTSSGKRATSTVDRAGRTPEK